MSLPVKFLYSAFKLEVTFAKEYAPDHTKHGTGFFAGSVGGQLYLVTNRHVLDAQWDRPGRSENSIKFRQYTLKRIACFGRPDGINRVDFELLGLQPIYHERFTHDVAVVPVRHAISNLMFGTNIMIENFVGVDDMTTAIEFQSDIDLCDQVGIPGYGEAHAPSDVRPICRVGYVISDPRLPLDYEEVKGDALLVEAFSTSGASGSPVFVFEKGVKLGAGLASTGKTYRRWSLLGVNAGHMESSDFKHSQVSYAFKSTVIREILNARH